MSPSDDKTQKADPADLPSRDAGKRAKSAAEDATLQGDHGTTPGSTDRPIVRSAGPDAVTNVDTGSWHGSPDSRTGSDKASGPIPYTLEDLHRQLIDLNLISEKTWDEAAAKAGPVRTPSVILDRLTEITSTRSGTDFPRGALTAFQAETIRSGKASWLRLEHYILLDRLGAGGMGEVYKVYNLQLSRVEAIKLILPDSEDGTFGSMALQRFKREATILASLNHPCITTVFHAGYANGVAYIAMEYIRGVNMRQHLEAAAAANQLPAVTWVVERIIDVADALQHAHESNIIHRDIKPQNVMINEKQQLKVLDMGIARLLAPDAASKDALGQTLTKHSRALGTPDFMPPEQWADATAVTAASDIYSLGCTFYYMLTGKVPFPNPSADRASALSQLMMAHVSQPPPAASAVRRDVPKGIDAVIARMMAKDQRKRYASAAEVVQALQPYTTCGQLSPDAQRRRRIRSIAVGVAGVVMVAALAVPASRDFLLGFVSRSHSAETLRELIAADPENPGLRVALAKLAHKEGAMEEAIKELSVALKLDPKLDEAWYLRGNAYRETDKPAQALDDFVKAVQLKADSNYITGLNSVVEPRFKQLVDQQQYPSVASLYQQLADLKVATREHKQYAAIALARTAESQLAARQFEQAIQSADQALALVDEPDAYGNRGVARAALNQEQPAFEDLKKAVASSRNTARLPAYRDALATVSRALGSREFEKGSFAPAAEFLKEAVNAKPDDADSQAYLGRCYQELGRTDDAIAAYREALNHNLRQEQVHNWLAAAYFAKGAYQQAVEMFGQAKSLAPAEFAQRAKAQLELGNVDGAVLDFRAAFDGQADLKKAYATDAAKAFRQRATARLDRQDYAAAAQDLAFAGGLDPAGAEADRKPLASAWLGWARNLAASNDFVGAAERYTNALELEPKSVEGLLGRAKANFQTERFAEAVRDFSAANALDADAAKSLAPTMGKAHAELGEQALAKREVDVAIKELLAAVTLDPESRVGYAKTLAAAYAQRAEHRAQERDYSASITDFEQASKLDEKEADQYWLKAASTALLWGNSLSDQGKYADAISAYDRAVALNPKLADGFYQRGFAQLSLDQEDRAKADFEAAAKLDPKTYGGAGGAQLAKKREQDGREALKQGNFEPAISALRQAMVFDPQKTKELRPIIGQAYASHARKLAESADYVGAVAAWKDAAYFDQQNQKSHQAELAVALSNLGVKFYKEEKYAEAVAQYSEAIRLEPKNALYHANRALAQFYLGDYDLAVSDYERAATLDADNAAKHHKDAGDTLALKAQKVAAAGDFNTALAALGRAIELNPSDKSAYEQKLASVYTARAEKHHKESAFEQAVADWRQAVTLDPTRKPDTDGKIETALLAWSDALIADNKPAEAMEKLSRLLSTVNASSNLAHARRSLLRSEAKDFAGAVKDFENTKLDELDAKAAQALKPAAALAYANVGLQAATKSQSTAALAAFDKAAMLAPEVLKQPEFSASAAKAHYARGLGRLAQGIKLQNEGKSAADQGNSDASADAYAKAMTELAAAAKDLELAATLNEKDHLSRNYLAYILATRPRERDGKRALEFAETACRLTEFKDPMYLGTLAAGYAADNQFEKAAEWQQKAIELAPEALKATFTDLLDNYYKKNKQHP